MGMALLLVVVAQQILSPRACLHSCCTLAEERASGRPKRCRAIKRMHGASQCAFAPCCLLAAAWAGPYACHRNEAKAVIAG